MNMMFKNRKTLYLVLGIVMVCVFSLTVVYATLNTVLEITGNAEVLSASWDIHLDNVQVKNGSVDADTPVIKDSSTLSFDVVLNKPGDYYEFTVDVVNNGSIDAMIDSIVKTPELTSEQAKIFLYEISYANGERINTKQTLKKKTSTPIKVRVQYRKDLTASDLPTMTGKLSLSLTLLYAQSDNAGSSIPNSGVSVVNVVSGDGTQVGDEICISDECFYVISSTDETVTMLSKYNLYVGGVYKESTWIPYGDEATGKQDSTMLGWMSLNADKNGTTEFSNDDTKGEYYSSYVGSVVELYVNDYNSYLLTLGVYVDEARLITADELVKLGCNISKQSCNAAPNWVYSTSYWTGTAISNVGGVFTLYSYAGFDHFNCDHNASFGVRPVIVISRNLI